MEAGGLTTDRTTAFVRCLYHVSDNIPNMTELKTRMNQASVEEFIRTVKDPGRQADCREIMAMMGKVTGRTPRMWGPRIVGFGSYHYRYASGREGDWFLTGFSPGKKDLTLYIMTGFDGQEPLMDGLGKYRTGKSCLYVSRLADIDRESLRALIAASVARLGETYEVQT